MWSRGPSTPRSARGAASRAELRLPGCAARSRSTATRRWTGAPTRMARPTPSPASRCCKKLPDIVDFCRVYLGVDPVTEMMPIQPTAHYTMGGIPTNKYGEVVIDDKNTVFPGLYAAGECACVSVHGANRLGTQFAARPGGVRQARRAEGRRVRQDRRITKRCRKTRKRRRVPSWSASSRAPARRMPSTSAPT